MPSLSRVKSGKKARDLVTLLLGVLLAFILSGQTWYAVAMSPNDEAVTLQNFDGFTVYAWLAPMLLVCLAAVAVTALMSGAGQTLILSLGLLVSSLLALLAASSVINQDLGGVSKQLETATGIAATHGITGISTETLLVAYSSVVLFCLISAAFLRVLIVHRRWKSKRDENKPQLTKRVGVLPNTRQNKKVNSAIKSSPQDSIGLWDEQR